jgi:hypothetical protein
MKNSIRAPKGVISLEVERLLETKERDFSLEARRLQGNIEGIVSFQDREL